MLHWAWKPIRQPARSPSEIVVTIAMAGSRLAISVSKGSPSTRAALPARPAGTHGGAHTGAVPSSGSTRPVRVRVPGAELSGDLVLPEAARGVVLFAHGSGSSRHSPRNRLVAAGLHAAGYATLLIDLL